MRLRLMLGRRTRIVFVVLQIVPPGLGAILAGRRNPHTHLRWAGVSQVALFLLGAWPLAFGAWPILLPFSVSILWATWDAVRIVRAELVAAPPPESAVGHA